MEFSLKIFCLVSLLIVLANFHCATGRRVSRGTEVENSPTNDDFDEDEHEEDDDDDDDIAGADKEEENENIDQKPKEVQIATSKQNGNVYHGQAKGKQQVNRSHFGPNKQFSQGRIKANNIHNQGNNMVQQQQHGVSQAAHIEKAKHRHQKQKPPHTQATNVSPKETHASANVHQNQQKPKLSSSPRSFANIRRFHSSRFFSGKPTTRFTKRPASIMTAKQLHVKPANKAPVLEPKPLQNKAKFRNAESIGARQSIANNVNNVQRTVVPVSQGHISNTVRNKASHSSTQYRFRPRYAGANPVSNKKTITARTSSFLNPTENTVSKTETHQTLQISVQKPTSTSFNPIANTIANSNAHTESQIQVQKPTKTVNRYRSRFSGAVSTDNKKTLSTTTGTQTSLNPSVNSASSTAYKFSAQTAPAKKDLSLMAENMPADKNNGGWIEPGFPNTETPSWEPVQSQVSEKTQMAMETHVRTVFDKSSNTQHTKKHTLQTTEKVSQSTNTDAQKTVGQEPVFKKTLAQTILDGISKAQHADKYATQPAELSQTVNYKAQEPTKLVTHFHAQKTVQKAYQPSEVIAPGKTQLGKTFVKPKNHVHLVLGQATQKTDVVKQGHETYKVATEPANSVPARSLSTEPALQESESSWVSKSKILPRYEVTSDKVVHQAVSESSTKSEPVQSWGKPIFRDNSLSLSTSSSSKVPKIEQVKQVQWNTRPTFKRTYAPGIKAQIVSAEQIVKDSSIQQSNTELSNYDTPVPSDRKETVRDSFSLSNPDRVRNVIHPTSSNSGMVVVDSERKAFVKPATQRVYEIVEDTNPTTSRDVVPAGEGSFNFGGGSLSSIGSEKSIGKIGVLTGVTNVLGTMENQKTKRTDEHTHSAIEQRNHGVSHSNVNKHTGYSVTKSDNALTARSENLDTVSPKFRGSFDPKPSTNFVQKSLRLIEVPEVSREKIQKPLPENERKIVHTPVKTLPTRPIAVTDYISPVQLSSNKISPQPKHNVGNKYEPHSIIVKTNKATLSVNNIVGKNKVNSGSSTRSAFDSASHVLSSHFKESENQKVQYRSDQSTKVRDVVNKAMNYHTAQQAYRPKSSKVITKSTVRPVVSNILPKQKGTTQEYKPIDSSYTQHKPTRTEVGQVKSAISENSISIGEVSKSLPGTTTDQSHVNSINKDFKQPISIPKQPEKSNVNPNNILDTVLGIVADRVASIQGSKSKVQNTQHTKSSQSYQSQYAWSSNEGITSNRVVQPKQMQNFLNPNYRHNGMQIVQTEPFILAKKILDIGKIDSNNKISQNIPKQPTPTLKSSPRQGATNTRGFVLTSETYRQSQKQHVSQQPSLMNKPTVGVVTGDPTTSKLSVISNAQAHTSRVSVQPKPAETQRKPENSGAVLSEDTLVGSLSGAKQSVVQSSETKKTALKEKKKPGSDSNGMSILWMAGKGFLDQHVDKINTLGGHITKYTGAGIDPTAAAPVRKRGRRRRNHGLGFTIGDAALKSLSGGSVFDIGGGRHAANKKKYSVNHIVKPSIRPLHSIPATNQQMIGDSAQSTLSAGKIVSPIPQDFPSKSSKLSASRSAISIPPAPLKRNKTPNKKRIQADIQVKNEHMKKTHVKSQARYKKPQFSNRLNKLPALKQKIQTQKQIKRQPPVDVVMRSNIGFSRIATMNKLPTTRKPSLSHNTKLPAFRSTRPPSFIARSQQTAQNQRQNRRQSQVTSSLSLRQQRVFPRLFRGGGFRFSARG